jgi:hypothetical protein
MDLHAPGVQDDSDLRPGDHHFLRRVELGQGLCGKADIQPIQFARIVEHPDFGAALLVSTGDGRPFYIPKSRKQLAQMIEEAARVLAKLP